MCGIFGATGVPSSKLPQAHAALHTLTHRGPDGWQHTHVNKVYMGHRRLAIIDTSSAGLQPMVSHGTHLTVNGEIYNFQSLRQELITHMGATFTSGSDSEVLLHAARLWGLNEAMEKCDGMFAFALHDTQKGLVHLGRDPLGIKPLYYAHIGGQLAWASELEALEAWFGPENLTPDPTALYDFLTYGYIPTPKSLYQGIFKLPPAHTLTFSTATGQLTLHKYWSLNPQRQTQTPEQAMHMVESAISQAVREQLVSDVPLGAFLSGGVDSSIVCYEAAQVLNTLTTCSIGMEDAAVDETPYAQAVAKVLGTTHRTERTSTQDATTHFARLREWFAEPFADTSAFPTQQVAALARRFFTVVLTGDGGDEIFAGYNHHHQWHQKLTRSVGVLFPLRGPVTYLKNHTRGPLQKLARKVEPFTIRCPLTRRIRLSGGLIATDAAKQAWRKRLRIPATYDDLWHLKEHDLPHLPPLSRVLWLDFHTTLPDRMLTKVDRTSSSVALEARVPLLAKNVVETAWKISEKNLKLDGEQKGLLKHIYARHLPRECLYRKKQGFSLGKQPFAHPGTTLNETILTRLFSPLLG